MPEKSGRFYSCVVVAALACCVACNDLVRPVGRGTAKYGWNAERYFRNQPQVVALCDAISAHDLVEIDRLIDAGVDINARGSANMTPLLWAYPERNLPLLEHLLDRGADPNVLVLSEFSSKGLIKPGQAVTHVALFDRDVRFFELVFANGGDPNLAADTNSSIDGPPITELILSFLPDKRQRIKCLIQQGADLDRKCSTGVTPAMYAVVSFGQYDIALQLLEAGADWRVYKDGWLKQLPHVLLGERTRGRAMSPPYVTSYKRLYTWLEANGVDFASVQSDLDRWRQWENRGPEYSAAKRKAEAARNRRHFEAEHAREQAEADATP